VIELSIHTKFIKGLLEKYEDYVREKFSIKNLRALPPEIKGDFFADVGVGKVGVPIKIEPMSHGDALWLKLTISVGLLEAVASKEAAKQIAAVLGVQSHGGTVQIPVSQYGVEGFTLLFSKEHLNIRVRMRD